MLITHQCVKVQSLVDGLCSGHNPIDVIDQFSLRRPVIFEKFATYDTELLQLVLFDIFDAHQYLESVLSSCANLRFEEAFLKISSCLTLSAQVLPFCDTALYCRHYFSEMTCGVFEFSISHNKSGIRMLQQRQQHEFHTEKSS